ncbi:MAG: solute carrier family 13 (sodium-dependent dicarboxylate transporter), member 2/3/5 [Desulfobacteraceae bacterium Eth-SRB1]|nr:MAG: solute carrier family 13 (sodium-dependent dicarboxylate transporter), member 2/3/5 [Desulfobacteraceae bacterium Eth-SRB1]
MEHGTAVSIQHKPFSWPWWKGAPGQIPIVVLGIIIFFVTLVYIVPTPQSMIDLVQQENVKGAKYKAGTNNYVDSYNKLMKSDFTPEEVAHKMVLCVAMLFSVALLWGTEAITLAATDILVGLILYIFMILPINEISKAYMKDAVFFILGVLVLAAAVGVTGLDRRIGNILLGKIKGLKGFCFIFFPVLAVISGFLSEHALVALLCPILVLVYMEGEKAGCSKKELQALACTLFLGICFAANVGGSGSPAVGGRAAIMVGYFSDYGMPMSFGRWMMYGLPVVPPLALACGLWIYISVARKTGPARTMDLGSVMRKGVEGIGPLRGKELLMAIFFAAQVVLWIGASAIIGLGGATMLIVFFILVTKLMTWEDVQQRVRFDVVGLYAGACAMGVALKYTGAGVWIAQNFVNLLPEAFHTGMGIVVASSLITTIVTNFMSDGAAVGALGPVVLPMAAIGDVHLWKVGLACSFGSSYAHAMIVGTVNNAIAYGLAKHPETGEQLLTPLDFVRVGLPFVFISMAILWLVAFFGYWQILPWPAVTG